MKKKSRVTLFCEGTSIRGMQKVLRARSRFLRFLWLSFVFIMSTVLVITSTFLVLDYLQYKTAWQISTILDEKSTFPSITLCSHNPFSIAANDQWRARKILTPTDFRKRLTTLASKAYKEFGPESDLATLPFYDRVDSYYAQLKPDEAWTLGHQPTMMQFCMTIYSGWEMISSTCNDTNYQVLRISTAEFLNCWTIETRPESLRYTKETESHQMILKITPSSDIKEMNDNFIMDMLSRGEGVRMAVHEPGTYPELDKFGINLQPGKMNAISFRTIRWHRLSTPKAPCKDNQPYLVDLDRSFNYTFSQCLNTVLQRKNMEKCHCLSTRWPRPVMPSDEMPYCFRISDQEAKALGAFRKRVSCGNEMSSNTKTLKEGAEGKECFHRCTFYTYETTASVSKWSPSTMKLERLNKMYKHYEMNRSDEHWISQLSHILHRQNYSGANSSKYSNLFQESRFIYISLNRKSFDIKEMTENLVLDINILVSRIGGLCSLCIGLTCAFFIELIEFVYLFFNSDLTSSSNGSPEGGNESFRGHGALASTIGGQPSTWYSQPQQETAYHFSTDTPSHHVMLEPDSSNVWSSPWRKMNNNHELTSRRMDPSISCV